MATYIIIFCFSFNLGCIVALLLRYFALFPEGISRDESAYRSDERR
jgi:hypothetical protein